MRPGVEGATRNAQYRVAPTSITPLAIHLGTVLGKKRPRCIARPEFLPVFPDEDRKNRLLSVKSPQESG